MLKSHCQYRASCVNGRRDGIDDDARYVLCLTIIIIIIYLILIIRIICLTVIIKMKSWTLSPLTLFVDVLPCEKVPIFQFLVFIIITRDARGKGKSLRGGAKKCVNQLIRERGKYSLDKIGYLLVITFRISMDWNQLCPAGFGNFHGAGQGIKKSS